jgi:hypothetical protein
MEVAKRQKDRKSKKEEEISKQALAVKGAGAEMAIPEKEAKAVLKQKELVSKASYQIWLRSELEHHPETTDCSLVAENGQSLKVHLSLLSQIWPLVENIAIPEKKSCMCDRTVIILANTKISTIQNFLDLLYQGKCLLMKLSEVKELEDFQAGWD